METVEIQGKRITDTMPAWAPWALLALGTVAASVSAILIRYANEAPALAISFWRCAAGAVILAPFALARLRVVGRKELISSLIAGAFLAVHFATWITSIELTSIAASVLLVSTAPVFVAIVTHFFLGERVGRKGWIGILIAIAGTLLIAGGDFGGSSLEGNILALIGGATAGYYFLFGQIARRKIGIVEYAVIAYTTSAILLLFVIVPRGVEISGFEAKTWLAIAGLVIGSQLLGHTMINLVLSDIDATTVSVAIMAEPIIATILAALLFSEIPSSLIYPGGIAILAGIYLVSVARRQPVIIVE